SSQWRLRVALNRSQRRPQLVRDVNHEILADIFQFLQLRVLGLQTVEHELEFFAGFIELGGEQTQFTAGRAGQAGAEIAFGQLSGELDDGSQAIRDIAREKGRQDHERQKRERGG